MSAPCAAGSWDWPSPVPGSQRRYFWDLWVVGQTLVVLSCPEQQFPCVPLVILVVISRWDLLGELGSGSKQERLDGVN